MTNPTPRDPPLQNSCTAVQAQPGPCDDENDDEDENDDDDEDDDDRDDDGGET